MSIDMLETIIKSAFCSDADCIDFVFHGGEPLLRKIDFFKKAVFFQKKYNVNNISISNRIQTNGILLNNDFLSFFKDNDFEVGFSVDGPYDIQNRYRKTSEVNFNKILKNIKAVQDLNIKTKLIAVVNDCCIGREEDIFNFFLKNKINNYHFNANFYGNPDDCISPEHYGTFLTNYLKIWLKHDETKINITNYTIPIRKYILGKENDIFKRVLCENKLIFEPNGKVYICDFFDSCKSNEIGSYEDNFETLKNNACKVFSWSFDTPEMCKECEYKRYCLPLCPFTRKDINGNICKTMFYCSSFKKLYKELNVAVEHYLQNQR